MYKNNRKTLINNHIYGNNKAEFKGIVDEYRQRVFHTAYGIVQNTEDAKDITQEVFLKVFEKMGTFKGNASLSTWIYRITVNTCIDMLRKRRSGAHIALQEGVNYDDQMPGSYTPSHHPDSPFEATYNTEIRKNIKEAFMKLSSEHRSALVLREIEGLSYQKIAETMSCSVGTVMSRLHYARKKMQKLLAPYRGDSK